MTLLCDIEFGSRLYKTTTENSDTDYKAVYKPSLSSILMGTPQKTKTSSTSKIKNTKNDIDKEAIPLQRFIEHFRAGQSYAIEIVQAVSSHTASGYISDQFLELCMFLSKNIPHDLGKLTKYVLAIYMNNVERYRKYDGLIKLRKLFMSHVSTVKTVGGVVESGLEFGDLNKEFPEEITYGHQKTENSEWQKCLCIFGQEMDYNQPISQAIHDLTTRLLIF